MMMCIIIEEEESEDAAKILAAGGRRRTAGGGIEEARRLGSKANIGIEEGWPGEETGTVKLNAAKRMKPAGTPQAAASRAPSRKKNWQCQQTGAVAAYCRNDLLDGAAARKHHLKKEASESGKCETEEREMKKSEAACQKSNNSIRETERERRDGLEA